MSDISALSASTAADGSVGQAASISVLRKALNMEAASAAQLIEALPEVPPTGDVPLATSGSLGTQINTYA